MTAGATYGRNGSFFPTPSSLVALPWIGVEAHAALGVGVVVDQARVIRAPHPRTQQLATPSDRRAQAGTAGTASTAGLRGLHHLTRVREGRAGFGLPCGEPGLGDHPLRRLPAP